MPRSCAPPPPLNPHHPPPPAAPYPTLPQVLRMSEALRWAPVASDTKSWLEVTDQLTHSAVNVTLAPPTFEPYSTCTPSVCSTAGALIAYD
jgi:hypothetical protein